MTKPKSPVKEFSSGKRDFRTAPQENVTKKYIDDQILRIRNASEGKRNDLLNIIVHDAYQKGLVDQDADDFEERIADAAMDAGLEEIEVQATIQSARRAGIAKSGKVAPSGNGVLEAVIKNSESKGVGGRQIYTDTTISTIELALKDIGYQLRFNTLSARPEAKKLEHEDWLDLSHGGASIRRDLEDRCLLKRSEGTAPFIIRKDRFKDVLDMLEEDKEYHVDPVAEWQKSLPEWDKKQRLATIFNDALGCMQNSLSAWAGYYMFCSPLIRAATRGGEGYSLDQMIFS